MAIVDLYGCHDTFARRGRNDKIKAQMEGSDGEARVYFAAIIMARRERIDPPVNRSPVPFGDCP